ncbi:hypothetical protein MASR2M78_18160 [Treponema sp.]
MEVLSMYEAKGLKTKSSVLCNLRQFGLIVLPMVFALSLIVACGQPVGGGGSGDPASETPSDTTGTGGTGTGTGTGGGGTDPGTSPTVVAVTGITVSPETLTLHMDETGALTVVVLPSNATVKTFTWTSSATTVATVDTDGKVHPVSVGDVVITATSTDGAKTATCTVTVLADPLPSDFELNGTQIEYAENENITGFMLEAEMVITNDGIDFPGFEFGYLEYDNGLNSAVFEIIQDPDLNKIGKWQRITWTDPVNGVRTLTPYLENSDKELAKVETDHPYGDAYISLLNPALQAPVMSSVSAVGRTVTASWSSVAGATGYRLLLGSTDGFNGFMSSDTYLFPPETTATSATVYAGGPSDLTLQVRAIGSDGRPGSRSAPLDIRVTFDAPQNVRILARRILR